MIGQSSILFEFCESDILLSGFTRFLIKNSLVYALAELLMWYIWTFPGGMRSKGCRKWSTDLFFSVSRKRAARRRWRKRGGLAVVFVFVFYLPGLVFVLTFHLFFCDFRRMLRTFNWYRYQDVVCKTFLVEFSRKWLTRSMFHDRLGDLTEECFLIEVVVYRKGL